MSAILNSLNIHIFLIFQLILMKLVPTFMVYRALSDKSYLLSGLRSPLKSRRWNFIKFCKHIHMYMANTTNKKIRARGQYYWSYFPL